MSRIPTLKMTRGSDSGRVFELDSAEVAIGSGIRNDIVLPDPDISPKHCRLVQEGSVYRLFDTGSKRGTFVGGKLVLSDGITLPGSVIIELGETVAFEYTPPIHTRPLPNTGRLRVETAAITTFYLVIRRMTEQQPEIYPLDNATVTIGRELANDIVLPEPKVSRHHLRLERVNKGYILHDLKTSNGTYVNRHKIELPTLLQPGDYLAIADAVEMWYTDNLDALRM